MRPRRFGSVDTGAEEHQSKTRTQMLLELAIRLLSFSLSKADYTPKLAEFAGSVRTHMFTVEDGALDSEIEFLHEAIDQYLKKALPRLPTPK